ncbi:MAG: hypothetical protein RIF36_14715 [Imperialibacter sp.]|uniref:hypothetical protein n=1 Tax=unclassified Imperialibacter TaxID=2629706 RepID=UPI00125C6CD2|nr:hypothetical protein [Imperialibacter sp. 89]CAD5256987.1 conserved exported hypothetical protein [Imperialibacter sp. 75]CAD5259868.1 conserved exported hypothetical protein [Imperialibacter sp. 89]VVT26002.1 conserved exported hypothetical protein [Imperialibacter sp. EC-SDR9]
MKISHIIIASFLTFSVSACSSGSSSDHGHEHAEGEEHSHAEGEDHEHPHAEGEEHEHTDQEEFTVKGDTLKTKADSTHTHDDGTSHQNH